MGVWNIEAQSAEVEHSRRESRSAVGAEGGEVWGGGVPLPTGGEVWEGGSAPLPENLLTLDLQMVNFGAFLWFFFNLAACFTRKNQCFWASKICRCNSLLYFKLTIMIDGLTSHHNAVSLTDCGMNCL